MQIVIYSLACGITLLQIADFWLTYKVLAKGGTELNPVMARLMGLFGRGIGLAIGKIYTAIFVLGGTYLGWFDSREGVAVLALILGLYVWVVWHNWVQYRKG